MDHPAGGGQPVAGAVGSTVRVVLMQILSLALVALGVLGFGYRPYRGLLRWLFAWTARRPLAWGLFLLAFLALLTLPSV